jgi:hypothetical protein
MARFLLRDILARLDADGTVSIWICRVFGLISPRVGTRLLGGNSAG